MPCGKEETVLRYMVVNRHCGDRFNHRCAEGRLLPLAKIHQSEVHRIDEVINP